MPGGKVLYVAEYLGHSQYSLKIRTPRNDKREFFTYDPKKKTINMNLDRRFVIANENGKFKRGQRVVLRPYEKASNKQEATSRFNGGRINNGKFSNHCLDVYGGKNVNGQKTTWWPCHAGKNQKWTVVYKQVGGNVSKAQVSTARAGNPAGDSTQNANADAAT